jgi:hypothetical protein
MNIVDNLEENDCSLNNTSYLTKNNHISKSKITVQNSGHKSTPQTERKSEADSPYKQNAINVKI